MTDAARSDPAGPGGLIRAAWLVRPSRRLRRRGRCGTSPRPHRRLAREARGVPGVSRHFSIACSCPRWSASRTPSPGGRCSASTRSPNGPAGCCSPSPHSRSSPALQPRLSWQTTRLAALTAIVAVGAQLMAPVRFRAFQGDTMVGDVNGLLNSGAATRLSWLPNVYYPWDIWTAALLLLLIATCCLRLRRVDRRAACPGGLRGVVPRRLAESRDDDPDRAVQPLGAGAAADARSPGRLRGRSRSSSGSSVQRRHRVDDGRAAQPEVQPAGRGGVVPVDEPADADVSALRRDGARPVCRRRVASAAGLVGRAAAAGPRAPASGMSSRPPPWPSCSASCTRPASSPKRPPPRGWRRRPPRCAHVHGSRPAGPRLR